MRDRILPPLTFFFLIDAFIAEMSRIISGSNVEQGTYDDWAAADIEDLYRNLLLPYWTKFHQRIIDKFKHELYVVEYKGPNHLLLRCQISIKI